MTPVWRNLFLIVCLKKSIENFLMKVHATTQMKNKAGKIFCCFFSLFLIFGFSGPKKGKDTIQWSKDRPLTWDDFKATQPPNAAFAAETQSEIYFDLTV